MAQRVIWSLQAQHDRKEILSYWRTRNNSNIYSKKLNDLFKKAVKLIAAHPNIGSQTDIENVRAKVVRDYLIFYETTNSRIEILSVWDTRRNPDDLIRIIR